MVRKQTMSSKEQERLLCYNGEVLVFICQKAILQINGLLRHPYYVSDGWYLTEEQKHLF